MVWAAHATHALQSQPIPLGLPSWVGDHMLIPSNRQVPIRGTAAPGTKVSVEFADQVKHAEADEQGGWQVVLDPIARTTEIGVLTVSASGQDKRFSDVAVGDVWFCSGQSNMGWRVKNTNENERAAKASRDVDVRYFNGKSWVRLTEQNVSQFSAVGAWFAMETARLQDQPVGFIVASKGGTDIEAWVPKNAFPETERGIRLASLVDDPEVLKAAKEDGRDFRPYGKHRLAQWGLGRAVPSTLFKRLIQPQADMPISGVVWYQGESNASGEEIASEYGLWLKHLVASWRELFKQPGLPFIVIQLPEYDPGTDAGRAGWAQVQEQQAAAAKDMDGVWLVSTKGLGDLKDIHPRQKQDVGVRAAEVAHRSID